MLALPEVTSPFELEKPADCPKLRLRPSERYEDRYPLTLPFVAQVIV